MGPFVTLTALWGYPYLVEGRGLATGTAGALLLLTVVAFGASPPVLGAVAARGPRLRTRLTVAPATSLPVVWALVLAWPEGRPPVALLAAAFALVGVAGAAGMLAFDIAREGNPAERSGVATGLVNVGASSLR